MKWIETQFWKFAKYLIKKSYGYEPVHDRDGMPMGAQGRCAGCRASEVQDWIGDHIDIINM